MDRSNIRVLLGCEESDAVRSRMEAKGFDAWSCDIQYSSNIHNKKHIRQDILTILNDGWDVLIAFPPCTHLAVSGGAHFAQKIADGRQQAAIDFFMAMVNAPVDMIAIENPVGIMSSAYKQPSQIIEPYYFGDTYQKKTCLWLKNLPPLFHNNEPDLFNESVTWVDKAKTIEKKTGKSKFHMETSRVHKNRGKERSKTFKGIADAMAEQWADHIEYRVKKLKQIK